MLVTHGDLMAASSSLDPMLKAAQWYNWTLLPTARLSPEAEPCVLTSMAEQAWGQHGAIKDQEIFHLFIRASTQLPNA